ncbi:uncharacterized protein PGTG_19645 [Puccinia graminis f. sp. tritici CRL 75-36-700-3]|uniref:Uncharacterized protein n=1 Tax=Puccinia graminis f. sp. tritici (strain CRL 75-36-700-3 / race SCCL) TaxID=418459 RepID=E3LAL7_PUCGT|nr:uncharacterized protein PGTG_19645 [Puccinia graminis f. sp. tritici CRL 75-36-700-3]EFP93592.1 hypothetical protein PGTG_19645 [Puccinia graminis f. sp. tritici CRL 75-36-700-3]
MVQGVLEIDLQETMLLSAVLLVILGASTTWAAHKIDVVNHCRERFSMQIPGHGVIASVGNNCDTNGVPCTAAEFALVSGISSADITLIPPHRYNHSLRITLTNGQSKSCQHANCPTAFHQDGNDGMYQIQEANNPNSGIKLEFCY